MPDTPQQLSFDAFTRVLFEMASATASGESTAEEPPEIAQLRAMLEFVKRRTKALRIGCVPSAAPRPAPRAICRARNAAHPRSGRDLWVAAPTPAGPPVPMFP